MQASTHFSIRALAARKLEFGSPIFFDDRVQVLDGLDRGGSELAEVIFCVLLTVDSDELGELSSVRHFAASSMAH